MSGIERQRIVGKSEAELDELTCGICHDIFDDPVVTQCCRQTFCTLCISQWLVNNNTCPNDRKILDLNGLVPAARMVINIINHLNIKCQNYDNGCDSILLVQQMKEHLQVCDKYQCHSCKVSNDLAKKLESDNIRLKSQLKSSDENKKLLQKQNEKLEHRLNKLNDHINNLKEELKQHKLSQREEIRSAQNTNFQIHSISEDIDDSLIQSFVDHCKNGFNHCFDYNQLARYVKDKIDDKTGMEWTVLVHRTGRLGFCLSYDNFIDVRFGPIAIKASAMSDHQSEDPSPCHPS